ncbi:MAG: hypothetical protein KKA73_02135 [Chloroflexi bacterium]|nr:hypothetical protein [Chloroflexota bacterium]MBU1746465.1 hypothetical protein [Chloroflexota bacterium]MBU1879468.1 hypothetical protein [Chloroflexota bacterium]
MKRRIRIGAKLALLGLMLTMMAGLVPIPLNIPPTPIAPHLSVGIHTLRLGDDDLRLIRGAGCDWAMQVFSWREIEPLPQDYHWEYADSVVRACDYYGVDLIVRLDQQPEWAAPEAVFPEGGQAPPADLDTYGDFCATVAARYRGRVRAYVVWNEPNLAREWGEVRPDPLAYMDLLRVAYRRIKAADPDALVVSAGLSPTNENTARAMDDRLYLRMMAQADLAQSCDVVGVHAYGFAYPPDDPRGAHQDLNLARVLDLHDVLAAYGGAATPVWALEYGWTTNTLNPDLAWMSVTPAQQAEYVARGLERIYEEWPWLHLVCVWNLSRGLPPEDEKRWYSLLDDAGQPNATYHALATLPKRTDVPEAARLRDGIVTTLAGLWTRPDPLVDVLARDVVIRIGEVDEWYPHWARLHWQKGSSLAWEGDFYVREPGTGPWTLELEAMQVDDWGNAVTINGQALEPPVLPAQGWGSEWVTVRLRVPAGVLRPGLNTIRFQVSRRLPIHQDDWAVWESIQFRNVRLRPD